MSAFQPNKFQPVWRYIQKDMAVLILVVGSSRKFRSLSISFILFFFAPFLVSAKLGSTFVFTWTALAIAGQLLQAWQHISNYLDSSCKQQTTRHLLSMQQSTPSSTYM
jgi:hypothetical protein